MDIKQLLTAFERYAYGQSLHTAFTEFLDWTLLPFKMYNTSDQQNQALETYKSHPKVEQLVNLVTLIGDLSEDFNDPIGELYMQAISNGHNGQYFTPTPICEMISAMTIGEGIENRETILDPACGSGRMLLAAAKQNRHSAFYGADLDSTCCKMALFNMLLNSLKGEISHMNSLSNEFYTGYQVNTTLVNGYHMPYYSEFTTPELSYIWLKPNQKVQPKPTFTTQFETVRASHPVSGVQGSLF
ncbi:N-6 DNA methylase [Mucilaginibacter sp.]|uniref:N-6 DNA methylase n=1 Tax=Mucilaginibacter sp. TaxID=1882438 RepID=UPI00284C1134|nr:N-6 DNA methylase [Mucilaginibacter sp.]MDR3695600.1 N-6 DNA methylase [Mucilaginibacter sp.]